MPRTSPSLYDTGLDKNPATIALGKRTSYRQLDGTLESAYDLAGESMACNMGYEDAVEGIDAFLGKRAPVWRGR